MSNSKSSTKPSLKSLLSLPSQEIMAFLGPIYEHSPWVAEQLVERLNNVDRRVQLQSLTTEPGPASSLTVKTVTDLGTAMQNIVNHASREQKLALLNAHPDLCQEVSKIRELTVESQSEQSRAGLQNMTDEEMERFSKCNTLYREKFHFPFILAVRNATKHTVLAALQGRLLQSSGYEREFHIAIEQVHKIAWMRLLSALDCSTCKGFLTCHVLDTANGCPASNMRIQLKRILPEEAAGLIGHFVTSEDGRLSSGPALVGSNFIVGTYEWTFYIADYFAGKGTYTSGTPFLDTVPLRFGIDNPDQHYHVPLLVSPWSYSTYRGS